MEAWVKYIKVCVWGLWGCFDEFNRIKLQFGVVAAQVMSILDAKRLGQRLSIFRRRSAKNRYGPYGMLSLP